MFIQLQQVTSSLASSFLGEGTPYNKLITKLLPFGERGLFTPSLQPKLLPFVERGTPYNTLQYKYLNKTLLRYYKLSTMKNEGFEVFQVIEIDCSKKLVILQHSSTIYSVRMSLEGV